MLNYQRVSDTIICQTILTCVCITINIIIYVGTVQAFQEIHSQDFSS